MFGRHVTMKLKVDSAVEFRHINDHQIVPLLRKQKGFREGSLFVDPGGLVAIETSSWDTKDDAKDDAIAYQRAGYREVLKALASVVEGTPMVESFEVAESKHQKAAAKSA